MKIIFCREAQTVSDYEIEDFFEKHKNAGEDDEIKISNWVLLYRFRVAVKLKEIKPFQFDVIDFDGNLYAGECDEEGRLDDLTMRSVYQAKVISLEEKYLNILIGI